MSAAEDDDLTTAVDVAHTLIEVPEAAIDSHISIVALPASAAKPTLARTSSGADGRLRPLMTLL